MDSDLSLSCKFTTLREKRLALRKQKGELSEIQNGDCLKKFRRDPNGISKKTTLKMKRTNRMPSKRFTSKC